MGQRSKQQQSELFWGRVVIRKWLNIGTRVSDCGAENGHVEDDDDIDNSDSENEEFDYELGGEGSRFGDENRNGSPSDPSDAIPVLRRRKSETFRAQYINTKEIKIWVGTWNVGGKLPPDDLAIDDWLDTSDPADIYVLGLQEIVPLNAGNIFGAEDKSPVPKWEKAVSETLNRVQQPPKRKVKSYSDPPSPSRFKPPEDDVPNIEEEMLVLDSDSCTEKDDETDHIVEEPNKFLGQQGIEYLADQATIDQDGVSVADHQSSNGKRMLLKMLSGSERIGLTWPEPPLDLISPRIIEQQQPHTFKSFKTYNSFKLLSSASIYAAPDLAEVDLESLIRRKRKPHYVKIVSKQMVGIFLTIWVRRSLRRHIQNLKVSTVGVGIMGFIGNKGSISVSMSIYQTFFCFVCNHLTAGEKDGDEHKRNEDVREIHKRTRFRSAPDVARPKRILDHEKIIWFGDLNYRLNLSYDRARILITKKEWSTLIEKDQLVKELRKGRAFEGWSEGRLSFSPTYKYEVNSDNYQGDEPKVVGRRTPAWCDRILSYGKGMRQLCYRREELKLSDHRPVAATYMAEVEVFSPRKLQRALTFTDAEIQNEDICLTPHNIHTG